MIPIFGHKEKILSLSKLSENEILSSYYGMLNQLEFVHERDIPIEIRKRAIRLCEGVDQKDVVFVAASRMLDPYLWTGDKKPREVLAKRGFTSTISTAELLERS